MTTVLNNSDIIQNRTGQTIDSYTASGTNVVPSTADIVRYSGKTIALLHRVSGSNYACNLPNDAEIGDEVEIYADDPNGSLAHLPSGETLIDGSANSGVFTQFAKFIKVSSSSWALASR